MRWGKNTLGFLIMDHRSTVEELRAEIQELRIRIRLDKKDKFAARRIKVLQFFLADKLYFRRVYFCKARGIKNDPLQLKLSERLDQALAKLNE